MVCNARLLYMQCRARSLTSVNVSLVLYKIRIIIRIIQGYHGEAGTRNRCSMSMTYACQEGKGPDNISPS